jgi:tetratricopeptide (TPR) repeat protein
MKVWFPVISTLLFALAASFAGAESHSKGAVGVQSKDRVDAIWSYADARLDSQMDTWFDDGEFPKDIQLLRLTTQLRPSDYESWTNLGWMLENVQDWDGALQVYKEYQANNPHDSDGALPLGEYYFRMKKFALVPPLFEPAIARRPHPHPNVFRILAHSYERLGKFSDAERVWKSYIAIAPKDDAAKNNLMRVEKKLGQKL